MTQPLLSSFFKKSAAAPKRTIDDVSDDAAQAAASNAQAEEDCAAAIDNPPAPKKAKDDTPAVAVEGPADAVPAPTKKIGGGECADLPPALQGHPMLQPVAQLCDGWKGVICREAKKPYFNTLMQFLDKEEASKQVIYPPRELVFSAFRLCPWDEVKVVILGQDPYHGPNQAHGLAFSVNPPTPTPPSLANMVKEAMADVGIRKPTHGSLENWSRQGVLLLNAVLTVRRGAANSHRNRGWETFTDAVVKELDARKSNLVFLLWGKPAQDKGKSISRAKHRVFMCAHPSPLSAHKTATPFMGSKSFSKVNDALKSMGKPPIDWNL